MGLGESPTSKCAEVLLRFRSSRSPHGQSCAASNFRPDSGKVSTWTQEVCNIMAFMAIIRSLG